MAGQLELVATDRNFQVVLRWVQEEMESFVRRARLVPEYRDYVQDCRSKLRTMAVRFQAFVEEFNNVWYHGNISSLSSGMAKFSAFCCCYGLSRSFARTLLKSIKRAKEQFDRFDISGSDLSVSCLTKLQDANKQTSSCDNSALKYAALVGGLVVGSVLLGPLGWAMLGAIAYGAGGAVAAAAGGGAAAGAAGMAGVNGVRCRGQSRLFEEIEKMLKDIHKLVAKFREIASLLMEKLDSLKVQCIYLIQRNDGGSFVYRTMNSIFARLEDIHEQTDHVFPELQEWTSAQTDPNRTRS